MDAEFSTVSKNSPQETTTEVVAVPIRSAVPPELYPYAGQLSTNCIFADGIQNIVDDEKKLLSTSSAHLFAGRPSVIVPHGSPPSLVTDRGSAFPISQWTTGAFSCMSDMPSLIESTCCMRCQLSRQYNKLSHGKASIEWWTLLTSLTADIVIGGPLTMVLMAWYMRYMIRGRYQIVGSHCDDALCALGCTPLVVCQNYREMSVRGEWPSGCCLKKPFEVAMPTMGVVSENQVME